MNVPSSSKSLKTLVIGLDGGDLRVLRRLAKEGHMPFFASILERGTSGELRSVVPPMTPVAWPTFMTGKNPGKHGIFDFRTYENTATPLRLNRSTSIRADTLWSLLSRADKRVGVVNVPMTYPPQPVNGVMITGVLTPSTEHTFTYPSTLYRDLRPELGDYIIAVTCQGRPARPFIRDLLRCTQQRSKYVRHLMQREPWDFFMVVFSETDSLQHALWSYLDPQDKRQEDAKIERMIFAYFNRLDDEIRQICETAGQDTQLFFVSDHGFGPLSKWLYLNTWLHHQGWLTYKPWGLLVARSIHKLHRALRWQPIVVLALTKLHRILSRALQRLGGQGKKLLPHAEVQYNVLAAIDWERTKAFFSSLGEQGIRINVRGLEPKGIVSPGREYEELRDEIITKLRELRDPDTGEQIIEHVWKREELYTGPCVDCAPDIMFLSHDVNWIADVAPSKRLVEEVSHICHLMGNGFHKMEGMFVACGPGIKVNGELENAQLQDVMPTLLYSLQQPIPNDVDGRLLSEIFEPNRLSQFPPEFIKPVKPDARDQATSSSSEEEEQVLERLRGLGYIE
jgi:predicted AlkP superfamily phosphohydrolase/phosphomutase